MCVISRDDVLTKNEANVTVTCTQYEYIDTIYQVQAVLLCLFDSRCCSVCWSMMSTMRPSMFVTINKETGVCVYRVSPPGPSQSRTLWGQSWVACSRCWECYVA